MAHGYVSVSYLFRDVYIIFRAHLATLWYVKLSPQGGKTIMDEKIPEVTQSREAALVIVSFDSVITRGTEGSQIRGDSAQIC